MTRPKGSARCQRCGSSAEGQFCSNCGAALREAKCPACGSALAVGDKFCTDCGAEVGREAAGDGAIWKHGAVRVIATGAVAAVLVIAFLIGRGVPSASSGASGADLAGGRLLDDLAALTPQERASRLYDRVMLAGENGRLDSARYFAPLAVEALKQLGALDAHARYDIGMINAVVGDTIAARAQADSILGQRPTHLLGLALAIRTARTTRARDDFTKRLLAANGAESAAPLPEYADHRSDVERAMRSARQPKP